MPPVKLSDITSAMQKHTEPAESINATDLTKAVSEATNPADPKTSKKPGCLKVHIEIESELSGRKVKIVADVCTKEELDDIDRRYKGYMPRKKFLGLF